MSSSPGGLAAPATGLLSHRARQRAMAATLTVVVAATLASLLVDAAALKVVAAIAYLAFVAVAMVEANRRDCYFVGAALGLSLLIVLLRADPWPILGHAVLLGSFFATFLLALNVLRDAAKTSTAVRRCGNYVIAQPPGRRYAALTVASHLFAVILNYGVVNLLGTMVRRSNTLAAAGGDVARFRIRERRMMLAVLRGQSTMVGWSPLSILIAISIALIPGLTWSSLAPAGAIYSVLFLALGWLMDRIEFPPRNALAVKLPYAGAFLPSVLPMAFLLVAIFALVLGANALLQLSLVSAIMLMLPVFELLWIAVQFRHLGPRLMTAMLLRRIARMPMREFAASRSEALILSTAAYIGAALSALLPQNAVETLVQQSHLPWLAIAIILAMLVPIAGQLGVNALVMLTLVGGSLHHMAGTGLPSVLLAVALLGGASLSIGSSPYGTPVVLIAGLTGRAPEHIGRVWNGRFTIAALLVLCLYLAALSQWFPR